MYTERKHIFIDIPTLIVVSFMAWMSVNAIYKIVEYVGAAVLVGTPIQAVSIAMITLDWDPVLSGVMPRFVSAGGLWANLIIGCLALAWAGLMPFISAPILKHAPWLYEILPWKLLVDFNTNRQLAFYVANGQPLPTVTRSSPACCGACCSPPSPSGACAARSSDISR